MRNHAAPFWRKRHDSLRHSTAGFRENVLVAEDTLPNVKSFIICDREGLINRPSKEIRVLTFLVKKKNTMKLYRVSIFCEYAKSQSFSLTSNLHVSIAACNTN